VTGAARALDVQGDVESSEKNQEEVVKAYVEHCEVSRTMERPALELVWHKVLIANDKGGETQSLPLTYVVTSHVL
jgi:hypothetical protein